ncbi:MAG TPA: hypothetical protein DCZ95_19445 [Verrucomicrobia bacterium]|nr:hypothetical protein [Verrucomicrobiota bacterium]
MRRDGTKNRKIHEALNLLNEVAAEKKDDLQTLMSDRYADLMTMIGSKQSQLSKVAHHSAQRVAHAKDEAAARVGDAASRVNRHVRDEPWQSLGWVAVVGFALGYVLGRKK